MKRKKERIDTSGETTPLGDSPFASLGSLLPEDHVPEPAREPRAPEPKAKRPYRVAKTRKGGYPITFEKRAKGKKVTCIANIEGDGNALLKALKQYCGAGGVFRAGSDPRENTIELQGDQREKVEAWLKKQGL